MFHLIVKKQITSFAIWVALILAAFSFSGNKCAFAAEADRQMVPQVHLKARFVAFSNDFPELQDFMSSTNSYEVLTDTAFQKLLHTVEHSGNYKSLGEPEVWQLSSRKTRLDAMEYYSTYSKEINPKALMLPGVGTTNDIFLNGMGSHTQFLETGPALHVIPQVMTNNFTIKLSSTAIIIELQSLGNHVKPDFLHPECWKTNSFEVFVRGEKQNVSFAVPDFRFQTNQIKFPDINLYDNQTVVLKCLDYKGTDLRKDKSHRKHLMIFVTTTITDPAGNRINSDEELPFARDAIPPQI